MRKKEVHKRKGFRRPFFLGIQCRLSVDDRRYVKSLQFLIRRKWVTIIGLLVITGATLWLTKITPTGFIPTEDQGFLLYALNTPPGSSLDRTAKAMAQVDSIVKKSPIADQRYIVEGMNIISNSNASPYGVGFIRMKPKAERGEVRISTRSWV
jgi:HAE1 family hydrophobic/amphiphilic exporter-1